MPVNVCGQMSGSPTYTMLLLGLGLRQLSVTPSAIPEIKKVCRSVTIAQCEAWPQRAMAMENARDIKSYLREELKKVVPEVVDETGQRDEHDSRQFGRLQALTHGDESPQPRVQRSASAVEHDAMARHRVRIRFRKQDDLRLISHRDLVRTWERLFRRAELPLAHERRLSSQAADELSVGPGRGHRRPRRSAGSRSGRAERAATSCSQRSTRTCAAGLGVRRGRSAAAERHARPRRAASRFELRVAAERHATLSRAHRRAAGRRAPASIDASRRRRRSTCGRCSTSCAVDGDVLRMRLRVAHEAGARPREVLAALGLADLRAHGCI